MSAKEIADKYIGRRGGKPRSERARCTRRMSGPRTVRLSETEYAHLLAAAECDDMIAWCEGCGAWMHRDEAAYCPADEVTGCWEYATGSGPCVKHRAINRRERGEKK